MRILVEKNLGFKQIRNRTKKKSTHSINKQKKIEKDIEQSKMQINALIEKHDDIALFIMNSNQIELING